MRKRLKKQFLISNRLLRRFTKYFEFRFTGRWMLYSFLIGVVAGLGGIVFFAMQSWIEHVSLEG
ncbi:MAG: hypothetical protein D6743_19000, partial [Calditrichaeota bacterium]